MGRQPRTYQPPGLAKSTILLCFEKRGSEQLCCLPLCAAMAGECPREFPKMLRPFFDASENGVPNHTQVPEPSSPLVLMKMQITLHGTWRRTDWHQPSAEQPAQLAQLLEHSAKPIAVK